MSDALFDEDPDDETQEPPRNVLAVARAAESSEELTKRAQMFRDPDYKHASMVIFDDGDETGNRFLNAAEFMRAMRRDTLPTMEEATAWLLQKRADVDTRLAARMAAP